VGAVAAGRVDGSAGAAVGDDGTVRAGVAAVTRRCALGGSRKAGVIGKGRSREPDGAGAAPIAASDLPPGDKPADSAAAATSQAPGFVSRAEAACLAGVASRAAASSQVAGPLASKRDVGRGSSIGVKPNARAATRRKNPLIPRARDTRAAARQALQGCPPHSSHRHVQAWRPPLAAAGRSWRSQPQETPQGRSSPSTWSRS
jgi:hypothetical protein